MSKFIENGEELLFKHEGNQSQYKNTTHNGIDGDLKIKININHNPNLIREGNDIISKHYVTLGQAIEGCNL